MVMAGRVQPDDAPGVELDADRPGERGDPTIEVHNKARLYVISSAPSKCPYDASAILQPFSSSLPYFQQGVL